MAGLELTVFLSGTMEDLREERTAIRSQIGVPLYRVVAAEDWGARCRAPRELCVDAARTSDVYLGLYGGRYGYILPDETLSVTEWEFNTAREAGKPALIYVRRGKKGPKQRPFLARVTDFRFGHNRRPEFENCDQLVAWLREDLITLMEDLTREAEADVPTARDPLVYVKCRFNLAFLAREDKQWEQAMHHYQWILSQGTSNETAYDFALYGLQSLYRERGLWEQAIEVARTRVEWAGVLAGEWTLPTGHVDTHVIGGFRESRLMELADLYIEWARADAGIGHWQEAADHLWDALEVYRELGIPSSEEGALILLAETYEAWAVSCEGIPRHAERAEAARAYRNAIRIYEKMRDRNKLAILWARLAQLYIREGKDIGALQCLKTSLDHQEEEGTPRGGVDGIVANLQAMFEIRCRRGWQAAAIGTLLHEVKVLLWAGRLLQATRTAESAVELCLEINKPRLLVDALELLGNAYEAVGTLGSLQRALTAYQRALDVALGLGTRSRVGMLRESVVRVGGRAIALEEGDVASSGGQYASTT